ncbi:MAG: class I SAM-dependent methyltransferase [Nitrospirota bacterium]
MRKTVMSNDKTVEAFTQYAADYDQWFDSPEGRILFQIEVGAVRLLMKGLEHPFLEVGVGTGRFAYELGIDFGIDPSARALEIAKKRGIKVKNAKGEKLPFEDGCFGSVFLLFTLCFVDDPLMVLSEVRRVLKKGGSLIVGFINKDSAWGKLYAKKGKEGHPIYRHARFYSFNEVKKMIRNSSMEVEACSSTLFQSPSDRPYMEPALKGLIPGAGFVCIRSRKTDNPGGK